ncbi:MULTISPECIES: AMP-binding protein [Luteimonas]|uniref:AMP-ligase n=1 Tax=Luteimonas chenhongjianii TaxID=2006110 RepID=A0A290XAN6_9GAMM|nr:MULTISPECIES: AMP-binding protein [Luteimonas]ATD66180.1 AMP-ligase [Luteimonas chenhongjianii]RPD84086.1 acyl-CoA synthetase [Luteimonas sp. 100069]
MSAVVREQGTGHGDDAADAGERRPLVEGAPSRVIAFGRDGAIPLSRFLAHVHGVAALLPDAPFALNLCEDRYRFLVAFCAVALRGQTTLLPPARTRGAIDDVRARHPHSYCIGDRDDCGCDALQDAGHAPEPPHYVRLPDVLPTADGDAPELPLEHVVAIGFTSGSTGVPGANAKTWASFHRGTLQNLVALADLHGEATLPVVATVPPQHMYGMEMSVLLPLLGNVAVHLGRPFFPEDIAAALRDAPRPALLVTTPVHLRTLVESGVALPPLAAIATATAPLSRELAAAAEARFGCEVRELFGSTETCIFARRRSAIETAWTPYPGVRLQPVPDGTLVHAPHLAEPQLLADIVELDEAGRFVLRGRQADMIEIAGKRASLADITRRLLAIEGVRDAVAVQSQAADGCGVRRVEAIVVADAALTDAMLLDALRCSLDPVFLPRRLRRVAALPRNETGKLTRAALEALVHVD